MLPGEAAACCRRYRLEGPASASAATSTISRTAARRTAP